LPLLVTVACFAFFLPADAALPLSREERVVSMAILDYTPQLRAKALERTRQAPPGWFHALVAAQDSGADESEQEPDRAHLERSRSEAASAGSLPGLQRSTSARPPPAVIARARWGARFSTLSLYAALNPQTGEVIGQTASRHTSQEFVGFLEEIVATQPAEREVHVILDNFSTHKTELVKQFLGQHPNVTLHFTPTRSRAGSASSSETWSTGIFTSV
jgi:hypothetical protein